MQNTPCMHIHNLKNVLIKSFVIYIINFLELYKELNGMNVCTFCYLFVQSLYNHLLNVFSMLYDTHNEDRGVWISNYILYKVWDEITYPFPNIKSAAFEVWEWIGNFISHFTGMWFTRPCQD